MRLEEEAQGRGVRLFVKRQVKHGRGLVHVIPAGEIEDEQRSHEVAAVLPPHGSVAGGDEGSMCDAGDVRIVPGLMTALATRVHAEALGQRYLGRTRLSRGRLVQLGEHLRQPGRREGGMTGS